ncbi:Exportin-1 [Thelohanellus kitauei]|uniref:Exportin-1 n=1 Tax=Thelohanellus kitauei TaxID=669202 RepID=A0A0C2JRV2_THEKT|nr:Exportin-1 [Thelohanellus kitauei]
MDVQQDRMNYLQNIAPKIFDFTGSFDVAIFDELTKSLNHAQGAENEFAKKALEEFLQDERSWCRVDQILEYSCSDESRFYALLILERLVKTRWKLLPSEQRIGIRDYLVQQIILVGSNTEAAQQRKLYLNKLLCSLVEILKFEWPRRWPEFLDEIVQSSKLNDSICLVNMKILRLLSEEIFQFSHQMNHIKTQYLKNALMSQFSSLFHHILEILKESTNVALIDETLITLNGFLPYIPENFVFDTVIIDVLVERLFKEPMFSNATLSCLAEIMIFESTENCRRKYGIYVKILDKIKTILPSDFDFNLAFMNGTEVQQNFLKVMTMFFSQSLKDYQQLFGANFDREKLIDGLNYILSSTKIQDFEIFKICIEFWVSFTANARIVKTRSENRFDSTSKLLVEAFNGVLSKLRYIIITNMKRPEEVIIFVNEHGEVVRQIMRDTDSVSVYNSCKDALSNLTYLCPDEIKQIILERLDNVLKASVFNWNDLNCIGWAVGSITGSMSVEMEREFIVKVLRGLLQLCDEKSGKDNKAIIASNIMYVVQQYPRFLKSYYKFLKTVVNKLFEFMSETHEGVQDMATDAFLKISKNCKYQLAKKQDEESLSYIEDISACLQGHVSLLNINQLQTTFEALGHIISAMDEDVGAQKMTLACLQGFNLNWNYLIYQLSGKEEMTDARFVTGASKFLKLSHSLCKAIGSRFEPILSNTYTDFLNIYSLISSNIFPKISAFGPEAAIYSEIKILRGIKRDFLNLIICYINSCHENLDLLKTKYFIPYVNTVLVDYRACPPCIKEVEVLSATTTFISSMNSRLNDNILTIFQHLFDSTMSMISQDLQDYPEHRVRFFTLIESITGCCFHAMVSMSPAEFDFIMQALFYAISHSSPNVSSLGLSSLVTLFKNLLDHSYSDGIFTERFHKTYFIPIFDRMLHLVGDGLHRSNLGEQSFILSHMINLVDSDKIKTSISEASNSMSANRTFVKEHAMFFLKQQHEHLNEQQLLLFVNGLFCFYKDHDQFVQHLKDFLITVKEYQGEDTDDLFADELKKEMLAVDSKNRSTRSKDDFQFAKSLHDYHTI